MTFNESDLSGGTRMPWRAGIGEYFSWAWDANIQSRALISDEGEKIIYVGSTNGKPKTWDHVFLYEINGRQFPFGASRNENADLTATVEWRIGFNRDLISNSYEETIVDEIFKKVKRDIKEALLEHPYWPEENSESGRAVRSVKFRNYNDTMDMPD